MNGQKSDNRQNKKKLEKWAKALKNVNSSCIRGRKP